MTEDPKPFNPFPFVTPEIIQDYETALANGIKHLTVVASAFLATPDVEAIDHLFEACAGVIRTRMDVEWAKAARLATPEDLAAVDMVICAPVPSDGRLFFTDNLVTPCAHCHRAVQVRPHAPVGPPRICVVCAPAVAQSISSSPGKES